MALGRPLTARGGPPLVAHVCPFPGSCSFPGVAGPLGPPPCPTGLALPAAARGSQRPNRVRSRRRRWHLGKRAGSRRRHGHEGGPLWRNVLGARPPESHAHSGTGRGRLGRSRNVAGAPRPGACLLLGWVKAAALGRRGWVSFRLHASSHKSDRHPFLNARATPGVRPAL